jgi:hypothetical protein
VLLTRSPLYSRGCPLFLVRLACVRHAASVDSEPGSNSRLKPVPPPRRVEGEAICPRLENCGQTLYFYFVRSLDLYPSTSSHDWHVQPDCQRPKPLSTLGGAFLSKLSPMAESPRNLFALSSRLFAQPRASLARLFGATLQTYRRTSCSVNPKLPLFLRSTHQDVQHPCGAPELCSPVTRKFSFSSSALKQAMPKPKSKTFKDPLEVLLWCSGRNRFA